MQLLRSRPEQLANFNEWIGNRITTIGLQALYANDWQEVLGLKYFAGELEAMRTVLNAPITEAQTLAELEELQPGGRNSDSTGGDNGLHP